ncbi:MAG: NAD-glutamate dehydrogenase domain-containing protein, partial [Gammaproteobacteria bacterium]
PIFESMGLQVLIGRPYRITLGRTIFWIHHFTLDQAESICDLDLDKIPRYFSGLFESVWHQRSENDAFNRLLFSACIKAKNIQIIRAYVVYMNQIRFPHSRTYIIESLNTYPEITLLLVKCFLHKFDPEKTDVDSYKKIIDTINEKLLDIESLDHDSIYRRMVNLIQSTVRTNYFQHLEDKSNCLSFKLDSRNIEKLPKPSPRFEIFVYSPRFEGIHLRGGLVARGGIRWSDRKEDYRTEVLGLMKAQMVKNAVIVPAGSKGGFITKQISNLAASEIYGEVQACYSLYIDALLELTDNLVNQEIIHPKQTAIHDTDDPYLVVAADKGTAAFSDVANSIAERHDFWLDDAFASGGSQGYDHKKMGITARGAWESVKRHFRGLGKDIQSEAFSVVGIGDMSGDVFGNGMLLSPCIQLVAAFNHMHIFIDPNPDINKSYRERQRLFALPRSSWTDYKKSLISKGGGVFSRKAKKIELNPEIQHLIDCKETHLTPNELIVYLLKARVDLIWNGGIGTYIKASNETNTAVSDKSNDEIRINGKQVRAKSIGEGGNLGVTQRGRIEFAQADGLLYTDSIDNSAGVDCSDNEVNIKILLSRLVKEGRLSRKERNNLLTEMTDEVAQHCLSNNYRQTQVIDSIVQHAAENMHQHARFMRHLEREGIMNRKLENLPNDEEITARIAQSKGLTRPELSILLSYSKLTYKNALLGSSALLEECYNHLLLDYFPKKLREHYADEILQHPLRKEIIATLLSNMITNNIGIGFGYRIREETGASIENIAKAYVVCVDIFKLNDTWNALEKLDNVVNEHCRYDCFRTVSGLLERSISWLLRNKSANFDVSHLIERYQGDIKILIKAISSVIIGQSRKNYNAARKQFVKYKLPAQLAQELAEKTTLASAFDIIEIKSKLNSSTENTAKLFYALSERLQLHWIRNAISQTIVRNHWNHLAIVNMRNDLHANQRNLTELILHSIDNKRHTTKALNLWEKNHADALERYDHMINELSARQNVDFPATSVAVSEIRRLVTVTQQNRYQAEEALES